MVSAEAGHMRPCQACFRLTTVDIARLDAERGIDWTEVEHRAVDLGPAYLDAYKRHDDHLKQLEAAAQAFTQAYEQVHAPTHAGGA